MCRVDVAAGLHLQPAACADTRSVAEGESQAMAPRLQTCPYRHARRNPMHVCQARSVGSEQDPVRARFLAQAIAGLVWVLLVLLTSL